MLHFESVGTPLSFTGLLLPPLEAICLLTIAGLTYLYANNVPYISSDFLLLNRCTYFNE